MDGGPITRPFPWASVTKPVAAVAALVAAEEGIVDLDEPAGPEGSTVRHLLAHASGLPFDGDRPIARPGQRRIYSNTGFEVLAAFVAERAEMAFRDYLHAAVLEPLEMTSTRLDGSPASGLEGPPRGSAGGCAGAPRSAPRRARDPRGGYVSGLPGAVGRSSGRRSLRAQRLGARLRAARREVAALDREAELGATFGHFGGSGSFLWVDPAVGAACAALSDLDFGDWAKDAWPRLSDAVLAELS